MTGHYPEPLEDATVIVPFIVRISRTINNKLEPRKGIEPPSQLYESRIIPLYERGVEPVEGIEPTSQRYKGRIIAFILHWQKVYFGVSFGFRNAIYKRMKPLYTPDEFKNAKSRDKLPFECEYCRSTFYNAKNEIQKSIKRKNENNPRRNNLKYCSAKCSSISHCSGKEIHCTNCDKVVYKQARVLRKTKHHFCSSSCAASYNNRHKTTGYRRSKLEIWMENQLSEKYPTLLIYYNKTQTIGSELDVYIPSLKLAFEFNGIFHYEEIYGTLKQIQNNDNQKYQKCIKNGISLCVIDVSHQKHFTPKSSQRFLDIVASIIDKVGATREN